VDKADVSIVECNCEVSPNDDDRGDRWQTGFVLDCICERSSEQEISDIYYYYLVSITQNYNSCSPVLLQKETIFLSDCQPLFSDGESRVSSTLYRYIYLFVVRMYLYCSKVARSLKKYWRQSTVYIFIMAVKRKSLENTQVLNKAAFVDCQPKVCLPFHKVKKEKCKDL